MNRTEGRGPPVATGGIRPKAEPHGAPEAVLGTRVAERVGSGARCGQSPIAWVARTRFQPTGYAGRTRRRPMAESRTLREWLVDTPPKHFAWKRAWRALVQVNRLRKRVRGERARVRGLGDVQRVLDHEPWAIPDDEALVEAKSGLRLLAAPGDLDDEERMDIAAVVDRALGRLAPRVATGPIQLRIEGWPPGLGPGLRQRILQTELAPPGPYPPAEAARIVRAIDGLRLAGHTVRVHPLLARDEVLPAVPRKRRGDPGKRGRGRPWLPNVDPVGRYSLTPLALARRHARLVGERPVFDAMAGLGGNTIAFAEAGSRVLAVERDPVRAALARRNVTVRGVGARVTLLVGDAEVEVPALGPELGPEAVLFLDPPWLHDDGRVRLVWSDLIPAVLRPHVHSWVGPVLLKLPPAFSVETLPRRHSPWIVRYELGDAKRGDGHVVKMLTAWSGPREPEL